MKHNEVKAFFKKSLQNVIGNKYKVLSVDKTNNDRDLYIVDSDLHTVLYVSTWFTSENFDIKLYEVEKKVCINKFKDMCYQVSGSYIRMGLLLEIINEIARKLDCN